MKQYCVQRLEVYRQDVFVWAGDAEDARYRVADGEGWEQGLHYDYTLKLDEWPVNEVL